MADYQHVVGFSIEHAPGLEGNGERAQLLPGLQSER